MGALDQLLVRGDQLFGARPGVFARVANVVDPLHHDDVRHARPHQDIPIEARQNVDARLRSSLAQHAVAADARIEHRDLAAFVLFGKATSQMVRPPVVGIGG